MAILGKVAGTMLKDNLLRNGTDLQIDTDLVYFDVLNRRVGIYNTSPGNTLSVNGSFTASNIYVDNNKITSLSGNLFLYSTYGIIDASNQRIGNVATPTQPYDATNKLYVDTAIATAEPNLTISDGTHIDNVGINYQTLTFFGNTDQMNVWVSNNQVTYGFIPNPTVYGNLTIQGNANTNLVGLVLTNSQPYINSLGVLTSLGITGNLNVNAVSAGQIGNTSTILEGTLATVSSNQPNIRTVGSLVSLNVVGNLTANVVEAGQIGNTNTILEGTIALESSSQPNITSLGTLIGLSATGTIYAPTLNAGTIGNSGSQFFGATANLTGNASVNALSAFQIGNTNTILEGTIASVSSSQPNITSTGTLVSLVVAGNITSANLITGNINSSFINSNGNLTVGNITATNAVTATTVNANIYTNYITAQSANGNVIISPTGNGFVTVSSTNALLVPSGDNGQYPIYNIAGMIRWNTSYNYLEVYTGTSWEAVGLEGTTVVTSDTFTGNGSQTQFTLSQNNTTQGTLVSINGVLQIPTTSYTVSGNVLTFAEAPVSTDIIEARSYAPGQDVSGIRSGNSRFYIHADYVGATAVDRITTIANGNIVAETTESNTAIFNTLNISSGMAANVSNIAVNSTTSVIDSFSPTLYRTAKYVVSATNTTSNYYQSAEALVVHNGTSANISTYNIVSTNGTFFTLSANIYSGKVSLWATTTANTNFKISNSYIPV